MDMDVLLDGNGITVKKLLKTSVIPYSDIRSIEVLEPKKTVFRTYEKEEYIYKGFLTLEDFTPNIFDLIKKNKIEYKDTFAMSDEAEEILSEEEMEKRVASLVESIREEAHALVKDLLGERYDIDMKAVTVHDEKNLYLRLLRDGETVKDIVTPHISEPEFGITDSFDLIMLAFLVEWNPREEKSKYVMALDDVDGFEEERKYLLDELRTICEKIRKDNSKEYLGQLP